MKPIAIAVLSCSFAATAYADTPAAGAPQPKPPVAVAQADAVATAPATTPAAVPALTVSRPAPSKLKGKFLTYGSFAMNAYTYLGASGKSPVTQLDPSKRAILFQQLGIGYFFHPNLRVMLTFVFGETASGLPAGASPYTTFGIIPWLVYTTHGFFTGIGPQLAPVSYGKAPNFDAGIYTATGYAVQLGRGFSLPLSVQAVLMLNQRLSFALTPSVALAYRF